MSSHTNIYTKNVQQYKDAYEKTSKKYEFVSWMRLVAIVLGSIAIYFMGKFHWIALILSIIGVLSIFIRLVYYHSKLRTRKNYLLRLQNINKTELEYLKGHFILKQNGNDYLNEEHSYALDLDIFGQKSLFHFINRTQTKLGERDLANALMKPATIPTIIKRQEASQELSTLLEWRQGFLATTETAEDDERHLSSLKNWLSEPDKLLSIRWLHWARYIVPLLTIFLAVFIIWGGYPLSILIFVILIPGSILAKYNRLITDIQNRTEKSKDRIAHYAQLIHKVETQSFQSKKLIDLQQKFISSNNESASRAIKQLGFYVAQLNQRNNAFAVVLNLFGLWDFHWALALEKWKNKHKDDVSDWFNSLGEFDFLISLANLRYNYHDWIFPNINNKTDKLIGQSLKHPLIFSHNAIGNNIDIKLQEKVMLITGSNMAGKSTFLRSIGVNLVLAFAGAVVYAEHLTMPILKVFTSMRTKDNLHESTSSFYAELKRLQSAMKGVEEENTIVLFDEILKGTNSVDRHKGAKAIINQIILSKSVGIVATHDLDLAKMEAKTNGSVENWCFDVEIKNGKLDFDYLIKRGVCSSFNATFLMKEMGFDIDVKEQ